MAIKNAIALIWEGESPGTHPLPRVGVALNPLRQGFKGIQRAQTGKHRDLLFIPSISKAGKSSDIPSFHLSSQFVVINF